ncbi:DUF5677 domain-containing protein [Nonomuraea sp. NPDC004297]
MHGRICVTAGEVAALTATGYADGASARTRTMHEILTIASLLSQDITGELAERYNACGPLEWLRDYNASQDRSSYDPTAYAEARAGADEATRRWGREIREQHGWARPAMNGIVDPRRRIRFSDLERAAGTSPLRAHYLASNHTIHGGPLRTINYANFDGGPLSPTRWHEVAHVAENIGNTVAHSARLLNLATHLACRCVSSLTGDYDKLLLCGELSNLAEKLIERVATDQIQTSAT